MFFEIVKFIVYSGAIVLISKYILVTTLRKLAEHLGLKPKTAGNIAGYATSVPELLTIGASSFNGLIGASIVNVLSSNIINLIQYMASILLNKNKNALKNKAIRKNIILVIITIVIPIVLILLDIEVNLIIVPIFIVLYFYFNYINEKAHKMYLQKEDKKIEEEIQREEMEEKKHKGKTSKYVLYLIITGILLFIIGDALGNTLESLANTFAISQTIIGILLGFITSIPELITFFESQKHYRKNKDNDNEILGVVEASNNLLTSNMMNLFIIQSIGILIYTVFI